MKIIGEYNHLPFTTTEKCAVGSFLTLDSPSSPAIGGTTINRAFVNENQLLWTVV